MVAIATGKGGAYTKRLTTAEGHASRETDTGKPSRNGPKVDPSQRLVTCLVVYMGTRLTIDRGERERMAHATGGWPWHGARRPCPLPHLRPPAQTRRPRHVATSIAAAAAYALSAPALSTSRRLRSADHTTNGGSLLTISGRSDTISDTRNPRSCATRSK